MSDNKKHKICPDCGSELYSIQNNGQFGNNSWITNKVFKCGSQISYYEKGFDHWTKCKDYVKINHNLVNAKKTYPIYLKSIINNIESLMSLKVENYVDPELTEDLARLHSSAKKWLDKTEIS